MFPSKEQVERIETKVDTLQKDITELHEKFDNLERLLQKDVLPSCNKMGDHIEFVECVYSNVKSPLGYLVGKVNSIMGGSSSIQKALPDIKKDDEDTRES